MKKKSIALLLVGVLVIGGAFAFFVYHNRAENDVDTSIIPDFEQDETVPSAVTTTQNDINQLPRDTSALGGYNVLIADRGNNRIIEVTPDKQIVWEYDFNLPRPGLGADDSFFTDGSKTVIANLENYHLIQQIDYATKKVTWEYGVANVPGSKPGELNTPDDAYKLANGDVTVADIKNCRVIEISPDKQIVRQYGVTKNCSPKDGFLYFPNGDTPLSDGHTLISNIGTRSVIELDQNWNKIFAMGVPVNYPSDPQVTHAGNILVSDYSNPGKIVEIARDGHVVWDYAPTQGNGRLDKPSLAIELPNGNILSNDDFNHRVIVVDKHTKQIIWQYGVTGKPGKAPGQLNTPDGLDIIMRGTAASPTPTAQPVAASPTYSVGHVTRNPTQFLNTVVTLKGYELKNEGSDIIISDESGGTPSRYDLPVSGIGTTTVMPGQAYIFIGMFVRSSQASSNGNPYQLALTHPPTTVGQ